MMKRNAPQAEPPIHPALGSRRRAEAQSRLEALLRAAERRFLATGYEATTLEQVLADAGGSKATLRKYFSDKAGLFAAVVQRASIRRIARLQGVEREASPERWLADFGARVLAFYLEPDSLTIYRTVIAIGHRDAAPARAFYEQGHRVFIESLGRRLQAWTRKGLVVSRDAEADADRFLHMRRAGLYERALLGLARRPGRTAVRQQAQACARLFLRGLTARR